MQIDILQIQKELEKLYAVPLPWPVTDFLITDRNLAEHLDQPGTFRSPEKLFICEQDDCLDLSLYIDADILERLAGDNPLENLHTGNLNDYLVTLEGVSHFVCVAWHAQQDRSLTLMELELQSEVDKFLFLNITVAQQGLRVDRRNLHRWLFSEFELNQSLNASQRRRYRDANNFAKRYCRHLATRYTSSLIPRQKPVPGRQSDLYGELRDFYRMDQSSKIHAIRQLKA